jgi:signal transduction histidine kinase
MRLIPIYLFVLLCFRGTVQGQNAEGLKKIAEIREELATAKADTNRVWMYIDLCTAYQWNHEDSLEKYSKLGIELSRQLRYPRGEIRLLNNIGIAASFRSNIPYALENLYRALNLAEKHDYILERSICLNNIGAAYFFLGDLDKSIGFINQALAIAGTEAYVGRDRYWKVFIHFWAGSTYSDLEKLDSARLYLQQAYDMAFDSTYVDLYNIRPTIQMFYGELLFKLGNKDQAFRFLQASIQKYEGDGDMVGLADACNIKAGFFSVLKEPDSAIRYARKGLEAATRFNYKTAVIDAARILVKELAVKDTGQAFLYQGILLAATDSLYGSRKIQELQKTLFDVQQRQYQFEEAQRLRDGQRRQNLFLASAFVLLTVSVILYRNNRQKQKANKILQSTLSELKATQTQLIQSEKMASLGELTAGIAHEIQNPLNFVNNFSELNKELIGELKEAIQSGNKHEAEEIAGDLMANEEKVSQHGKRADAIVKSMLQHSRKSGGQKEPTDINALCEEYLRLAYQGFRAKDQSFNASLETSFDPSAGKVHIDPQEIGQVLLNLYNNAFYALREKSKSAGPGFIPMVTVRSRVKESDNKKMVELSIGDNGSGIPEGIRVKIFQPFFTTKPTGQGTGLGLSLSYDIVTKGHGGELKVVTNEGEGTDFIIQLPNV